jgi:hypothetical protein
MSDIVYRTNNPSEWGTGQGSDLSAAQIDMNFWVLQSMFQALSDHALTSGDQIDFFVVSGDQLFVHLKSHQILGPYTLPVASWNFRGAWAPDTDYSPMDVVTEDNSVYLVLFAHTSLSTFDPNSSDGLGHLYYGLLLSSPFPVGGTLGQVWAVVGNSSPAEQTNANWVSLTRLICAFIAGELTAPEQFVFQFVAVENMTLPAGLTNSQACYETPPTIDQVFSIYVDGGFVGTIEFTPSPDNPVFNFPHAVALTPGARVALIGPAHPDLHMTNISITLVATLDELIA